MATLRPNCECCDRDLPPQRVDACICTLEGACSAPIARRTARETCPNCSGERVRRPTEPAAAAARFSASVGRVVKKQAACAP